MKEFRWKRVLAAMLIIFGFIVLLIFEYIAGKVVSVLFYGIFNLPYSFLCIVFNIVVLIMIAKICLQSIRYKGKIWYSRSNDKFDDLDILYAGLSKLPYKQEIIKENSTIIVNNVAGRFVIKYIKGKGILNGKLDEETWELGNTSFKNPFDIHDNNFLLKYPGILYNTYGIKVYDVSQIVFKIEKELLNVKTKM